MDIKAVPASTAEFQTVIFNLFQVLFQVVGRETCITGGCLHLQYHVSHFAKCSGATRKLSALRRRHPPPLFPVCWDGAFGCWQFLGEIVCCFVWDGRQCNYCGDTKTLMPLPWLLKSDHCDLKKKAGNCIRIFLGLVFGSFPSQFSNCWKALIPTAVKMLGFFSFLFNKAFKWCNSSHEHSDYDMPLYSGKHLPLTKTQWLQLQ